MKELGELEFLGSCVYGEAIAMMPQENGIFNQLFEHLPDLRVLLCKPCKIAIPPAQLSRHLQKNHPRVSIVARKECVTTIKTLDELAWVPSDVAIPTPAREAIAGLQEYENSFMCLEDGCWYICQTLRGIKGHSSYQHNWNTCQKRGGDVRAKSTQPRNRIWREGYTSQRLFKAVGWPAYFPVESKINRDERNLSAALQVGVTELQYRRKELEKAAQNQCSQQGSRYLANAWIEYTRWPVHLQVYTRHELLHLLRPEKHEEEDKLEQGLGSACKAMQRLIQKAFYSCQPETVGLSTLEFINRRETGAKTNEMPFYAKHKVPTVRKYSQRLVIILRYLWRTFQEAEKSPYKFTDVQTMHMSTLQQTSRVEGPKDKIELEACCLRFWISLLDHQLPGNEYESGLLSGLAILGVKPDQHGGGWVPAHEYSQTLSALITTSRALVVYHAKCVRDAALQQEVEKIPTTFELVKDMTRRFMTLTEFDGEPSPMNRMLHMRTYAYAKAKETMSAGRVSWDGDKLLIDKQSFTLAHLQSMAKGLYEKVRLQLLRDVLLLDVDETGEVRPGSTPLPDLCLDTLVDQPAEMATGWSFLKHPENHFEKWADWLFQRVLTESHLRERFVRVINHDAQPPRIQWNDRAVAEYMQGVRGFKEGAFALEHTSCGAPGRGSEVTTVQCENGEEGLGYRGIFAHAGMISFTTTYHKGYSLSKRIKTIHRYVPREVGEIFVYFLGLGRPFVDDLQMLHNRVTRRTAFLWEPEPEAEWDSESSCSDEGQGNEDDVEEEVDDEIEEEGLLEKDPRKKPANPDGFWGTDRVRRVMREQTLQHLGAALSTSTWRHAYPAIHRELARDGRVVETLDAVYYGRDAAETKDTRSKQAGHSHRTEEMVYGRAMIESPFQTMAEREEFRRVSLDWHRILGFASAWEEGRVHPATRSKMLAEQEEEQTARWAKLAKVDLTVEFKRLVGRADAEFRGKQEEGLRAIMQRHPRVLVIMATGGGKSMLFMLPAVISPDGAVTVVIVPLNALQADMQDRCDRLGIRCAKWDGRRPPYWASIVFVTPESAATKAFSRFIDEKRMLRQLDRIVIDECHVLMESTEKWRPQLLQMTEMTEKGTQVVYLTATLPKALEPAFFQVAGLDPRDVTVCRDRTTRINIQYHVQEYTRGLLDETLIQLVKAKQGQYPSESQVIIYCPSIKETKRLAKVLGCIAYYKEVGSEEEKARMVRGFTCGDEKLVTATNALGLGLDAPNVRVVIHVRMCDLLRQYIQESGRAGRSGLVSEAIVLRACWVGYDGSIKRELGRRLEPPSKDFLNSSRCRRITIDGEMDGTDDRRQCELGEEKCDYCQENSRGLKRAIVEPEHEDEPEQQDLVKETPADDGRAYMASMLAQQRRLESEQRRKSEQLGYELDRLRSYFDRWSNTCAVCMACCGRVENHSWLGCPNTGPSQLTTLRREVQWLESIQFQAYARCTSCWAPQAVCASWEEHAHYQGSFQRRKGGSCQYVDVLKHSVAALLVFRRQRCLRWLEKQMRAAGLVHGGEKERLVQWFGAKVKLGQREASQMCRFLYAWEAGEVHCI